MSKISEFAMHFLVNAAWQIAVVAIGASICARLLRNAPPRYRHAMWVAAILLCLALPLWGLFDLQPARPFHVTQQRASALKEPGSIASTPDASMPPVATANSGGLSLDHLLQRRSRTVPTPPPLAIALGIAYALFALYRLGALWRAWLRARRLKRSACERDLPAVIASVAERCRDAFGLKHISLRFSAQLTTPSTVGAWKPLIILPESLYAETSEDMLSTVLGHEMAHIARRDFAFNLVYEVLCLPVSFHPIANLVKRQIARTRELACDDMVTERLLDPEAYARSLVRAAGAMMPARQTLTMGVFDADILEERIMKLTRNTRRLGKHATRMLTLCSLALLCLTCIAISTFSFDLRAIRPLDSRNIAANQSTEQSSEVDQERGQSEPRVQDRTRTPVDAAELTQKLNSTTAQLRAEAACSAGRSRTVGAIPMLMAMLGDDTPIEPVKCWEEGRWSPALDSFKHPSPGEQAAIALASMGTPALEPLTNALNDTNPSVRRNAAWAIGELTNMRDKQRANAVPPLVRLLDDSDEWVRMAAAQALGEIRDERAVEGLITLLSDDKWQPRKVAAWALGEMKEERAVERLCHVLLSDEHSKVRLTVAWALGEIQDKRAVEALCNALGSDGESEVRRTAAWALGEIQDKRAVEALCNALASDRQSEVRKNAAWALGEIGSDKAVTFLKQALSDPDQQVRAKAGWALSEIEDSDR